MSVTCGRPDCGLTPGDTFCMICGRAAADVAAGAEPPRPTVVVEPAVSAPPPPILSPVEIDLAARDAIYLGNRQTYRRWFEEEMNPVRAIWVPFQIVVQNLLLVAAPAIVASIMAFIASFFFAVDQVAHNALTSLLYELAGLLAILAGLTFFVCCIVALFRRVPIRNADWIAYVDDRGDEADAVLAHIASVLQRRATPCESLRVKRVAIRGGGHRDVLEVGEGDFTGYITAYAFGHDLHVGWVFLWRLSVLRYVVLSFTNMVHVLRARQTEAHVVARYEPARSLREAIHAAAREGVDAAGWAGGAHVRMAESVPVDAVGASPDGDRLFAS
jgi:hypothetical protein